MNGKVLQLMVQLEHANRMLSVAASERMVMRALVADCARVLEELEVAPGRCEALMGEGGSGLKCLNHARQVLRPIGEGWSNEAARL